MNFSTNTSEFKFYFSKDFWLTNFGSTWLIDSIYLFAIAPIGLFGFILNLLSFYVLMDKKFNNIKVYTFFRAVTINSAILNLFSASLFTNTSFRYLEFTNSYAATVYGCLVNYPISNVCYIFGSTLDIVISIERCSIFLARLKALLNHPPKVACLVLFLISVLVGGPFFFIDTPNYFDVQLDARTNYRIWYWDLSMFGKSLAGKVLVFAGYFIRDVLFFVVELVFNVVSIVLFKKYFKNKVKFLSSKIAKNESSLSSTNALENKLYMKEKSIAMMVIAMCGISIVMHIFYFLVAVYFYIFTYDIVLNYLAVFSFLACALKNFSNFFLLYGFNSNFRRLFKKLVFNNESDSRSYS